MTSPRVTLPAFALLAAASVGAEVLTEIPRAAGGEPDLSGAWQALNTADRKSVV